jgi:hypothetical protein
VNKNIKTMKILGNTFKILGAIFGAFFIIFGIYANWEPKPLHAYAKATQLSIFKLTKMADDKSLEQINDNLEKKAGISAVAGNSKSQMLSVVFYPDLIKENEVKNLLKNENLSFEKANFEINGPAAAQCPVPAEYILQFEKIKYALNFR